MSSIPLNPFQSPGFAPDLLSRAVSLLSAEVARLQPGSLAAVRSANSEGAPALEDPTRVLQSSHGAPATDLLATSLSSTQLDELRRAGSQLLEALLTTVAQGKAGTASSYDDRVPLIRAVAPVQAGTSARATLRVTNEEATPSEVAFYASNFVADSGYEMPSLLMSVVPGRTTVAPGAEATFEIKIVVPAQAPAGLYSGLVQATGCKYVKAVVMFEVL